MKKLLLCLDLDETLIYTEDDFSPEAERQVADHTSVDGDPIFLRPWVREFIDRINSDSRIEFGVFTTATQEYADNVCEQLFKDGEKQPLFVFARNRCTFREPPITAYGNMGSSPVVIKDLKKVFRATGYQKENVLAIDDKFVFSRHRGNHLKVSPYQGEKEDSELKAVWKGIKSVLASKNVRECIRNHSLEAKEHNKESNLSP